MSVWKGVDCGCGSGSFGRKAKRYVRASLAPEGS